MSREELEEQFGQVWDTQELGESFTVVGFSHGYVFVLDKRTRKEGSLEFQHSPRLYFNFVCDR